jgi:galactose mutarotase-like enzyme
MTSEQRTLRDDTSGAVVTIEPARGGLITSFAIGDRQLLYMDVATLRDPTKNVRGGVPVLFPTPGKLDGDAWSYADRHGSLKQHGFARNLAWQVASADASSAVLRLEASDATLAGYPWRFRVEQTIRVHGRSLVLEQRVTNTDSTAMPFGFGFHPYFHVADADKHAVKIATHATRAFDNVRKQTVALTQPIDLTQPEVDLHLLDHGSTTSTLSTPAGDIMLRGSAEYTHWVVWTLAGKDFVCLEPWTCPGNALNTGERLIVLAPGEARGLSLEITA